MSKSRLLSIAVIGLLLINLGTIVFLIAGKPKPPAGLHGFNPDGPKKIIIERLHFDEEQTARYEVLITQHRQAIRKLDDSIRSSKNDLYKTLTTEGFEGKDVIIDQLQRLEKEVELTHYDHFADIKKICNASQLNDYNKLTTDLARIFAPGKKLPAPPGD